MRAYACVTRVLEKRNGVEMIVYRLMMFSEGSNDVIKSSNSNPEEMLWVGVLIYLYMNDIAGCTLPLYKSKDKYSRCHISPHSAIILLLHCCV